MFISDAFAQTSGAPAASGTGMETLIFWGAILLVMWFFILRPQAKRHKEHQAVITNLRKGDEIVTDSGIFGTITKVVDETSVEVEISEGVTIKVVRNAVSAVMEKSSDKKSAAKQKKSK